MPFKLNKSQVIIQLRAFALMLEALWFRPWFYHFQAIWSWTSYSTVGCTVFLIYIKCSSSLPEPFFFSTFILPLTVWALPHLLTLLAVSSSPEVTVGLQKSIHYSNCVWNHSFLNTKVIHERAIEEVSGSSHHFQTQWGIALGMNLILNCWGFHILWREIWSVTNKRQKEPTDNSFPFLH